MTVSCRRRENRIASEHDPVRVSSTNSLLAQEAIKLGAEKALIFAFSIEALPLSETIKLKCQSHRQRAPGTKFSRRSNRCRLAQRNSGFHQFRTATETSD